MRAFIISLPLWLQPIFVVSLTIMLAFAIANLSGRFFDAHQLAANTDITSAIFQVMGTIYAILLTFTLWGVWQNFTDATNGVQSEAFALIDLVHTLESAKTLDVVDIREAAKEYTNSVINFEWPLLQTFNFDLIHRTETNLKVSDKLLQIVQGIEPQTPREVAIFGQTIKMLDRWLDARHLRILKATGNNADSLWPLLIAGAFVLFAFHGLFIAKTIGIWAALLFGLSLIIGLAFYLIFSLDCPCLGKISVSYEPFIMARDILDKPRP